MRILAGMVCCILLVAGCSTQPKVTPKKSDEMLQGKPVVTPDFRPTGKVTKVNASAGYVIVNFPVTNIPIVGHRLNVYRNGLKTGELKVTGPEPVGGYTAADILAGDVQAGDEARED